MKIVDTCDSLVSIPPDRFLKKILRNRGYECDSIPFTKKVHPTAKQIQDYDQELVSAVKDSDVTKINQLHANGRCMSACNKFGESIVHIALRRGSMELVDFMLQHGADPGIVDDYGRVPLHDACWRPEPRFDIVTLLLDRNVDSLRMLDARGYSPLKYVREQHWVHWCVFLFHMTERFWPQHKSAENIGVEVGDYATASKDK
jgi:ankyrin repeat protein